jgi:bifunctional enzyme CysN/CysC
MSRGATIWITGLPAAGKSSLAVALVARLADGGVPACLLDGDELRRGLCADLGFGSRDRAENVRRTAHVARLVAEAGLVAVVALVSPYASGRGAARRVHDDAGLPFVEVYVDTPLEVCERRDPKGQYALARAGQLPHYTGVDDPYEPPVRPDVRVSGHGLSVEEEVTRVLDVVSRAEGVGAQLAAGP